MTLKQARSQAPKIEGTCHVHMVRFEAKWDVRIAGTYLPLQTSTITDTQAFLRKLYPNNQFRLYL